MPSDPDLELSDYYEPSLYDDNEIDLPTYRNMPREDDTLLSRNPNNMRPNIYTRESALYALL